MTTSTSGSLNWHYVVFHTMAVHIKCLLYQLVSCNHVFPRSFGIPKRKADSRSIVWASPYCAEFPNTWSVGRFARILIRTFDSDVFFWFIGIIYSDIGTSPLYVLNGIWPSDGPVPSKEDVIGGISAIIWSLTLLPLLKYVNLRPFIMFDLTNY